VAKAAGETTCRFGLHNKQNNRECMWRMTWNFVGRDSGKSKPLVMGFVGGGRQQSITKKRQTKEHSHQEVWSCLVASVLDHC